MKLSERIKNQEKGLLCCGVLQDREKLLREIEVLEGALEYALAEIDDLRCDNQLKDNDINDLELQNSELLDQIQAIS